MYYQQNEFKTNGLEYYRHNKMAKLRAYELNGGDMLELVRYQKRDLQKAAGARNIDVSEQRLDDPVRKKQTWRTWEIYRVH